MDRNSVRAWRKIKDDGRLTDARRRTLRGVVRLGPCTGQELVQSIGYQHAEKRLSELEDAGLVHRTGSRRCTITGETATVWEINPNPDRTSPTRRVSPTAQRIKALERSVEELTVQLAEVRKQVGAITVRTAVW